jgi:hypothetical protein
MSKLTPLPEVLPTNPEEVLALVKKAEKGDLSTLPALRACMKIPEMVDLFGGDLARHAQVTLISKLCGKNLASQEALIGKLELLRAELAGPNPTPLEQLLVERIAACWLHLYHLEQTYADSELESLKVGAYYQHCLDRAQRRYLSAIKALAMVRKLALPVLQVNIGQRQVNVASAGMD